MIRGLTACVLTCLIARFNIVHSLSGGTGAESYAGNELMSARTICQNGGRQVIQGRSIHCMCVRRYFGVFCELFCPSSFTILHSSTGQPVGCFRAVLASRSWFTAATNCIGFDPRAHLAVLSDKEKNDAVKGFVRSLPIGSSQCRAGNLIEDPHFFTAGQRLHDGDCSSSYYWKPLGQSRSPFEFGDWRSNEPNCASTKGYTPESCTALSFDSGYKWNDIPCESAVCFLCEISN